MHMSRVLLAVLSVGLLVGTRPAAAPVWRTMQDVAFRQSIEATVRGVTSLQVSPDGGALYAATLFGLLHRWPLDPETGALGEMQTLELPYFQDSEGPRGMIGLAFDPSDPMVLWVTDNHPVALQGANERRPDFTGRISRVRLAPGEAFGGVAEPYVSGLPRSCGDHLSNSLQFRANPDPAPGAPAHLLYMTQGSNSARGEADRSWCYRPERLLSAAVLEIDPRRTPPPGGFDVTTEPLPATGGNRRFGYDFVVVGTFWPSDDGDLKNGGIAIDSGPWSGNHLHFAANGVAEVYATREGGGAPLHRFYDPFAEDAPVRLFATGVRNGYDLVWHSNGHLYVPSNGPVAGGSTPDDPRTPANEALSRVVRGADHLFRLRRGSYAGHPNPLRDEFIAQGGNPTAQVDHDEVEDYPVGTLPDPRFDISAVYTLGFHLSPNGAVEYRGAAPLDGALIVASFSRGNNLLALTFDDEGVVNYETTLRDAEGMEIVNSDPLDVAMGTGGRLYLATMERSNARSRIIRLEPDEAIIEDFAQ